MLAKVDILQPYRSAISSLIATLLDPRHELGVFNAQTEIVRERVMSVISTVVYGATDRPTSTGVDALVRTLYAVHLALMFQWSQDRSDGTRNTIASIDAVCGILDKFSGKLDTPAAAAVLSTASRAFEKFVVSDRSPEVSSTAASALNTMFAHRRLSEPHEPCPQCLAPHLPLAMRSIAANEPMHLILPAFPAKSPSPLKVLGTMPDKADEIALDYLGDLCNEIRARYHPGVRLTICSDGHVFSDLVGVVDDVVTAFGDAIGWLIDERGLTSIDTFNMGDVFDGSDHETMRAELCRHYAEPIEAIVERCQSTPSGQALFNGIHRFMVEDRMGVEVDKSKTQIRKEAKERAYEVIRRSDAWGRLLADCFPTALRLSIHPHPPHGGKIGILLGPAQDVWLTPWHSAAVKQHDGAFVLMHRHVAEEQGAHIIESNGRPYYLEMSPHS
jgi:pyoverdine/dityrosine biosynthesis protein Dit1